MKLALPRGWLHSRIRYRITRVGALFAVAVALTGAGAFASANNLLFLIFSAMLALVVVSGFLSRLVLAGLEIELLLPEHVSARVATPARVRLRNVKRLTPSFSIELTGAPGGVNREPSILGSSVYFPLIPGHAVIEAPVEVTFPRRGRHKENVLALSTKFPFGFLRKSTTVALRRETIVYPPLEPDADAQADFDRLAGEVEMNVRGAGQDFYRIRPYEMSDGARMVDWKISAHSGALQVREFSREQRRTVEIFFDRRIEPGGHKEFERALERCAFVVWELSGRDIEVCFRSQRFTFALPEDGEVYEILRFLALTEPVIGAGMAGEERAEEATEDLGALRVVFAAQSADKALTVGQDIG